MTAAALGSLALSRVRPSAPTMCLRAVRWHEGLAALGTHVPFFLVHDVGLLIAAPPGERLLGPRVPVGALALDPTSDAAFARALAAYEATLEELAGCEVARRAGALRLSDDLVIVALARLFAAVAARLSSPASPGRISSDPSLFEGLEPRLPALFRAVDRSRELAALEALELVRLFVLTLADTLDADSLRLFGMFAGGSGALGQVDVLAALEAPETADIVRFSLEILPSVLETKRRAGAGSEAAFGYAGIGTRGSIDSLVLSELAWDDAELARRLVDAELLFYAREQAREEERALHVLLIDASASMRGDRQTFARSMALATAKKLLLEGEEVMIRFFDARLYEPVRVHKGQIPAAHVVGFRGERGRNPARVMSELVAELDLLRHRDGKAPVVHLFTHAALYIPRALVEAVRARAQVSALFMLPSSGALDLPYLDLLDAHWVVDHATLAAPEARSEAARSILREGAQRRAGGAGPA